MYQDFQAADRWSGQPIHCTYQALVVAVATRHADAVDIKFQADGRGVWISLPHTAWVEFKRQTGKSMTDALAIEAAGHFLKQAIENGLDSGREMHTLTVGETIEHINAVLRQERFIPDTPVTPRRGDQ